MPQIREAQNPPSSRAPRSPETTSPRSRSRKFARGSFATSPAIAKLIAHAVIARRIDVAAAELPAFDDRAVRRFVDRDAERAQTLRHRRDAVGFLDAQVRQRRECVVVPRATRRRRTGSGTRRSCPARARPAPRCRAAARARTTRSATRSPPCSRTRSSRMSAPIARSAASRPVRRGLMPTTRRRSSEPGTSVAATRKNAADEKSAGTSTSVARRRWPPVSVA